MERPPPLTLLNRTALAVPATDPLLRTTGHPVPSVVRRCTWWLCLDQSTFSRAAVSWIIFFILAVAVPAVSHELLVFREQRRPYDAAVQISLSAAALTSFASLSVIFRHVGIRRYLFLHKLAVESDRVCTGYEARLVASSCLLALLVVPTFAAEAAYKAWWYAASGDHIPYLGSAALTDAASYILELASWLYRSAIYFLACVMFQLVCHLQGLRLEDFAAALLVEDEENRVDVETLLLKHLDIRRQLKIISHRSRGFIVCCFLIVTAGQFATVLLTTRKDSDDSPFYTAELAICSIVLVSGLITIFSSAAKITHQAQALTSHTAKWHACCTIEPDGSVVEPITPDVALSRSNVFVQHMDVIPRSEADVLPPEEASDEESENATSEDVLENVKMVRPKAHTLPFQKRQALVTYLENNRAGITVYGFTMDRAYLHTVFMLEWTLFLWLLGKTINQIT